jgi:predicted DNA binding CopG/RHH family protein
MKLDSSEKKIENDLDQYRPVSEEKKQNIERVIQGAREKKSITLRLEKQDLKLIKNKAKQEGLPYQTLISSILHKYVTGQLVDEQEIIKSIRIVRDAEADK